MLGWRQVEGPAGEGAARLCYGLVEQCWKKAKKKL
jgi:hypothetical protein